MYNLSDNSSGYGAVHGGSSYGGAAMGFSMPVAPAAVGGYGAAAPIILGGGNGGMFGGCGDGGILGLLAILAIAGRGNGGLFGGGNDGGGCAIPTILSDNINGRFGALSDQISATSAAGISATHQAAIIDAVRAVDANVCAGFLQTQKGFGDVALESCRQTGTVITALNAGVNSINANVTQVGTQGLLAEMRTQAQLADCCCRLENAIHADGEMTRGLITQNTIQDLRDKNQNLILEKSQCAQNAYLASLINPPIQKSIPVSGNQNLFPTVISAEAFCGVNPNTSFRGNYGGGCGGYGNSCGC